ncbi:channel, hemolysin III family protein [Gregarina niphandrodes]|uniref:Channel, hemolysin III family protein n=1 Tax=Gregarina niphandrodes TaxID=110365 RepID=A0A023B0Z1_GRENI|nr:channel, hemolysin III family protein [Gregarina niphandrodes]EZG45043.1 channel, hemolysin III family protein [Gregarina niphandrodes]|eukprot:XP_011132592.1 channel, hemolysin III family protein [Gregarina niphandrodes]
MPESVAYQESGAGERLSSNRFGTEQGSLTGLEATGFDLHAFERSVKSDFVDKPRARGWIHFYSAIISLMSGLAMTIVVALHGRAEAILASIVYVLSLVAMFGTSAAYHIIHWKTAPQRLLMRRLDHSGIFVFIAGSYTFFATLCMDGVPRVVILSITWSGAVLGATLSLLWPHHPRYVGVPIYVGLGWIIIFVAKRLINVVGVTVVILLTLGGVFYTVGALCYAFSYPNPAPNIFGYHEVFHAFVSLAALIHHIAAWIVLLH